MKTHMYISKSVNEPVIHSIRASVPVGSDKPPLSEYIGNIKRPSLEEETERINRENTRRNIEYSHIRHLEVKSILDNAKKIETSNTNHDPQTPPLNLDLDLDITFDHTTVTLQSHPAPITKPPRSATTPPDNFSELMSWERVRFEKFKNVNFNSPKILFQMHNHIPPSTRQVSLEKLITAYKSKHPHKMAILMAFETESNVYDTYITKSGYWARINQLVKFEIKNL
jgi:hypothetical protein